MFLYFPLLQMLLQRQRESRLGLNLLHSLSMLVHSPLGFVLFFEEILQRPYVVLEAFNLVGALWQFIQVSTGPTRGGIVHHYGDVFTLFQSVVHLGFIVGVHELRLVNGAFVVLQVHSLSLGWRFAQLRAVELGPEPERGLKALGVGPGLPLCLKLGWA